MTGSGWVVVCAQVCFATVAGAQGPSDTTRYTESVRTVVVSHSGAATRERRVIRDARYTVVDSGSVTIVRADTLALTEVADGVTRQVDVDAVIGGRWTLQGSNGEMRVADRPFVPDEIADVSDVGRSLDDFWPPTPPDLLVGAERTVGSIQWQRIADSSGLRRFRWTRVQLQDTVRLVADSVPMKLSEARREQGSGAWPALGARSVAWRRDVHTTVETEVRRRVVRAEVEQLIVVRRDS